jgi:hypothetical protein
LRLTTQQLISETTRADNAEDELSKALKTLHTTIERHNRTYMDYAHVSEELRLYTIEYEASQQEAGVHMKLLIV